MAESEQIKAVISKAVDVNTGPSVTKDDANAIAATTLATMKADPVVANATGQEKFWQSGIAWFGSGGVLWALGWLITSFANNGFDLDKYDMSTATIALGSLGGFVGVLYRRFVPGLKPLFWKWS